MATVGNLFLSMGLKAEELDTGIAKIEKNVGRLGENLKKSTAGSDATLGSLGAKAGSAAVGVSALSAATGPLAPVTATVTAVMSTLDFALDAVSAGLSVLGAGFNLVTAPIRGFVGLLGTAITEVTNLTIKFLGLKTGLEAVNVGVEFEKSISRVKALTGTTGAAFDALRAKARKIGANTEFTSSQAASAMSYLAQSGFKPQEILDASDAVIQLASTAQISMQEASDISAKIIRGMAIDASDFGGTADILAMATINANTTLSQLGEAFKYVAPVAVATNKGIIEITGSIMALSDAGIQADQAGTTLSQMLMKIGDRSGEAQAIMDSLGISFSDLEGNIKPIPDIIDHLKERLSSLNMEDKLAAVGAMFGARAGRGVLSMIGGGGDPIRERMKLLEESAGKAASVAATQLDNVHGAIKFIQSAWEALIESIYLAFAGDVKQGIEALMGIINKLSAGIPDAIALFKELGANFAPMFEEINGVLRELIHENGPAWQALFKGFADWAREGAAGVKIAIEDIGSYLTSFAADAGLPTTVEGLKQGMQQIGLTIQFGAAHAAELWEMACLAMKLAVATVEAELRFTFETRLPLMIAVAPLVAFAALLEGMKLNLTVVMPAIVKYINEALVGVFNHVAKNVSIIFKNLWENIKTNVLEVAKLIATMGKEGGNFTSVGLLGGLENFTNPTLSLETLLPKRELTEKENELRAKLAEAGIKMGSDYKNFISKGMENLLKGTETVAEKIEKKQKEVESKLAGVGRGASPVVAMEIKTSEAVLKGSREALNKEVQFLLSQEGDAKADAQRRTAENTAKVALILEDIRGVLLETGGTVLGGF